jgi:hypothetical protein
VDLLRRIAGGGRASGDVVGASEITFQPPAPIRRKWRDCSKFNLQIQPDFAKSHV